MFKEEYELMYRIEEKGWWFSTKRDIVFELISKHFKPAGPDRPKILDVGCGTGIVLSRHSKIGYAFGVDFEREALVATARRNAGPLTNGSAAQLPFRSGVFDIVTCLDVLYHENIGSDDTAAAEIFRVLKPGGLFVMTDCALMALWGKHDISMQAARRYNKAQLLRLVTGAGFVCEKISYMNFFLLPFVFVVRKLSNLSPGPARSDVQEVSLVINFILKTIYGSERYLLRFMNLPLGSSIIAVCRKPDA